MVDDKKKLRAENIVELLGREPKDEEEENLKKTFTPLVEAEGVEGADAVEFVYVKLGGLVRTEAEQKKAVIKEKETKAKYNKTKKKDEED